MGQENFSKAIRSLRILGVISFLVSAVILLWQGFYDWEGFTRFLVFSGINLTLGGLGLFCAKVWDEAKGARTLFALATTGVAAQFAQVGGIVFDVFRSSEALSKTGIPNIFTLSGFSTTEMGLSLAVLTVIGIPIAYLTFKIFTGKESRGLRTLFFVQGALLLFPVRETWFMFACLLLGGLHLLALVKTEKFKLRTQFTLEKLIGLALALTPGIIHLGRSAFYIQNISIYAGAILALVSGFHFLFEIYRQEHSDNPTKRPNHTLSLFFGSLAWLFLAFGIIGSLHLPVYVTAFAALVPLISAFCFLQRSAWVGKSAYEALTFWSGFSYLLVFLASVELSAGILGVLFGGVIVLSGFVAKNHRVFKFGIIFAGSAIVKVAISSFAFANFFSWLNLAIIGIVIVVVASLLEKKAASLQTWQTRIRGRFELK